MGRGAVSVASSWTSLRSTVMRRPLMASNSTCVLGNHEEVGTGLVWVVGFLEVVRKWGRVSLRVC
jgi:hypothetical protein